MSRAFKVAGLGEVAIRCRNIDQMVAFYRDTIGLEIENDGRATSGIVFFRIGTRQGGVGGHTTVLALFQHDATTRGVHPDDAGPPATGAGSSLHHLALTIHPDDHERVISWYEEQGQEYRIEEFSWIGWRGIFTTDPEGNTVELVAHRPEWKIQ